MTKKYKELLNKSEMRLHEVAVYCERVERRLKDVNTAAMNLTRDLVCMECDDDDRLDRDRVMERIMQWRNEWDKAMHNNQPQMQPCAGRNCGSTNPNLHSAECFQDYEKATGMAQPAQEPVAWMHEWEDGERIPLMYSSDSRDNDEPVSVRPLVYGDAHEEPVAWMTINEYGEEDDIHYENPEGHLLEGWTYKPLYTHPPTVPPEKEPLEYWNAVEGWVKIDEVREHFGSVGCGTIYKAAGEDRVPVYTTPQQRTWVYLTDEHIKEIVGPYGDMPIKGYTRELFDRIEAKSKELNT